MTKPYLMSIEAEEGVTYTHGFHLGTDLAVAKALVEERYRGMVAWGLPVRTIAIVTGRSFSPEREIHNVYYGNGWDHD